MGYNKKGFVPVNRKIILRNNVDFLFIFLRFEVKNLNASVNIHRQVFQKVDVKQLGNSVRGLSPIEKVLIIHFSIADANIEYNFE